MTKFNGLTLKHLLSMGAVIGILVLTSLAAHGQSGVFISKEADTWYFGDKAGITFASGSPVALTDSRMKQHEGTAIASDPVTGDLLFYTNGEQIWDSTHKVMDNGTGLKGSWTSSQTVLVVRDPGDRERYYVFTVGAGTYTEPSNNGFRYSLVDMRLNGGLGRVTSKNIPVLDSTSEKLTATRHCNGRDYWILVHNYGDPGDLFYSYLLTPDGLQEATISQAGTSYGTGNDVQGALKFSPDGQLLAVSSAGPKTLEMFSFDRLTGEVSNPRLIDEGYHFYGIEFSRSGSRLYTALLPPSGIDATLSQYNLDLPDLAQIRASRVVLHSQGSSWQGAQLQMGPDSRIYVSFFRQPYLGVIKEPEKVGLAAGYDPSGIDLRGNSTEYGLPNFIQSNLFFETAGLNKDSLVNFPCTLPVEEDDPECPVKDSILLTIGHHMGSAEGDRITVPVHIERHATSAQISVINATIAYDPTMFLLGTPTTSSTTSGTVLDGWDLDSYSLSEGELRLTFVAPSPTLLSDTGTLFNLQFRTFLGFSSDLYTLFDLKSDFGSDTCLVALSTPGRADLDLCGDVFRLMDLASGRYRLLRAQWSAKNAALTLELETAFTGPTSIEVFDMAGNRVVSVSYPHLPAGNHNASVGGSSLTTGSYLVRVASGPWEEIRTVSVIR